MAKEKKKKAAQFTPRPWLLKEGYDGAKLNYLAVVGAEQDASAPAICERFALLLTKKDRADMEFIVRAANSHEALLKTVKLYEGFLDSLPHGWLGKTTGDVGLLNDALIESRKARALAEARP